MRAALRAKFPGIKFSIRSKKYAGGSSIRVSWVDGPVTRAVDEIVRAFTGASFDGMQDLKSYHDTVVSNPDGTCEAVHYGADYVFTDREFSAAFKARADEQCAEAYGREFWASYDDSSFPGKATALRSWCYNSHEDGTEDTEACPGRVWAEVLNARDVWVRKNTTAQPVDPWAAWIAREVD